MKSQSTATSVYRVWHGNRSRGHRVAEHHHKEAQLLLVASGAIQVYTNAGRWLVPPQLAFWIPAGAWHSTEFLSDTEFWTLYWRPALVRRLVADLLRRGEFALRVTALLRELVKKLVDADASEAELELVARLILYELSHVESAPTFLPMPTSALGRRIADNVLSGTALSSDVVMVSKTAATSVRTLSRLFPVETGLTFRSWRQRARIVVAMNLMSNGKQLSRVAHECGFGSTAAFSYAFRQVTGATPTDFTQSPVQRHLDRSSHVPLLLKS